MELATFYDTTLTDCESALALRAIAIPESSLAPHAQQRLFEWQALFGLHSIAWLQGHDEIIQALVSILGSKDRQALELATHVTTQPSFPFGEPLIQRSLADVLKTSTARDAASLVTLAGHQLLLVASPLGVVLCAPPHQLSGALDAGLAEKIREVMGLDGRQYRETGPATV